MQLARAVSSGGCLLLTLGGLGCSKSRAAELSPEIVYVSNEDSGTISMIDDASRRVLAHVAVGKRPRGVRVSPDGERLFVALSGSAKGGPHVDEAALPAPDRSADGIGEVDVATRKLLRILPSGTDPESFDLVGDAVFVSNEDAALASIISLRAGKIEQSVAVGAEPEGVTSRPDGAVVYVTSETDGDVAVIDARSRRVVSRIRVGERPRSIAFTPDGRWAYVTNELGASVSIIDARAHRLERTVTLPPVAKEYPPKPMGIVVAPDGEHAYVTTGRAGGLVELELRGGSVTRTLDGVGARPWGIDITRDGQRLYIANGPSNDVAVVDVRSWKVERRIVVERSPWGVAVGRAAAR